MTRFFILILLLAFHGITQAQPVSETSENEPTLGEPLDKAGIFRTLSDGNKFNIRIKDNQFIAYFTDAEGLVIKPLAESILIKVDSTNARSDGWRSVLKESSPINFSAKRKIYPPYNFFLSIIIRLPEDEVEAFHRVQFVGE